MKYFEIKIDGQPIGKGRPKFSSRNGFVRAYTPKTTKQYEDYVKQSYIDSKGLYFDDAVSIEIKAYCEIPKSTSKKKKQEMIDGKIYPTKKPDADNIAKIILDALNGVAYKDDNQVISLKIEKWYAEEPCVMIEIEEVK